MQDRDLAALYGVTTGNLNKAVQRNADRFPADFMFQLNDEEVSNLIFQFGRSTQHGGSRFNPYAFTQEGVAMSSSVLHSPRAFYSRSAANDVPRPRERERVAVGRVRVVGRKQTHWERVRVRCRFGICHPPAGETAPRNRLSRHSQGRCPSGQGQSKT